MIRFNWKELYGNLEELLSKKSGLKPIGSSLQSCHISLESARRVSQIATFVHTRMSRYRSEFQGNIINLRSENKLHSPIANRESGRAQKLQELEVTTSQIDDYLVCVNKVLAAAKDLRQDVSKVIKLAELENNIER